MRKATTRSSDAGVRKGSRKVGVMVGTIEKNGSAKRGKAEDGWRRETR